MKAINIDWDVDCEEDKKFLPTEIEIPKEIKTEDEIADYITDITGFCNKYFKVTDYQIEFL